ncbi:MAG: hypothetical protein AB2809_06970 [Candidatus Thiodiazotropha sp.]
MSVSAHRNEEEAWIHGKILADALRQQVRAPRSPLPIGIEASFRFFDIVGDSTPRELITSCFTCRIRKEGPGRWCVTEDDRVIRFRCKSDIAFDLIMKILAVGLVAKDGKLSAAELNTKIDNLINSKKRVIARLQKESAKNTANYLQDAIKISKNGSVTLHHLEKSGWLIFG